ncbi:unnamed protein product, partial [Brenthis ino]
MSEVKQVKVDNWGIYFLQRLKHFFNRTDYCDLTLQFQDNAQLKVHRLVLSACTEYFELLERTCEMYEDCLVMPDDLQADVVVPIINFMYTGQLEFKIDLLEKLYQTSLIMNMPVLTKLLASHRSIVQQQPRTAANNYYGKRYVKQSKGTPPTSSNSTNKRAFSSAFSNTETPKSKKPSTMNKIELSSNSKNSSQDLGASQIQFPVFYDKNNQLTKGARPTRYELPEELEEDNIFDNSFTSISYTSKPLMVHPETTKQYRSKRINLFEEGSSTSRFMHNSSNNDIVECKKITVNNSIFLDESSDMVADENEFFQQSPHTKEEIKDSNQLFDQIIENDVSNITIETKNKQSGSLDHAKIISEVLKKYPHLVKSNKQIKLKILNTAANKNKKPRANTSNNEEKEKIKNETRDFTYETDVIDSKEAARLIALGAENIKGPWICLICGTPGKALHFTKYYNFRKHLVEVHNEKPVPNICEYCGLKSQKRNYLVYHQLTKHGVEPPTHYNFPKCNYCDYIALNEALLVKHKITHTDISNYKRNICNAAFAASLMDSVQKSNKQSSYEKKNNLVCMYCLRVFLRQNNLYAHLKTNHKEAAKNDGLIYDSEEENPEEEEKIFKSKSNDITNFIKVEVPVNYEYEDVQYQLERRPDGNIHVVSKKPRVVMPAKHKILNPGFITQQQTLPSLAKLQQKTKSLNTPTKGNEFIQEICLSPSSNVNQEEIVVIDNNEYIVRDYQLFPKTSSTENKEETIGTILPNTSMEFHNVHNQTPETKMFIKKSSNLNQALQIVVSNEEEYKTLMNSNQSVIFDDRDSGKTLTVLAAADNSTMEASTIDLNNTQTNEMMIIPEDFSINVSETVSADNPNIVVVYSHPVEDPNKQYQLIATQEVGVEFVQSSQILTQSFETVTTCSPVSTTQTTGESWPSNIQATLSKLPITSAADLETMTVAESVTVPCETVSSNLNEYSDVTLTSNEPVPMDTDVIESQEQNEPDKANIISNIEQSTEPSCEPKAELVLHQQLIEDNNIHQPPISEPDVQSLSVDNVQTTVITDLISTPEVEEQPTISHHSDLDMVDENLQDIANNNPETVINVVVPELEIQQTAVIDNIEPDIENVENTNIDIDHSNSEICPEDTDTLLTSSDDHIVPQDIPNVADVVNEIQNIDDQTHEQVTEEMEVAETIENIARDIGVDPTSINKEIQSDVPQMLSDTQIINTENITLKTVTNEQIQSLTSEWSEDESEIAETVSNSGNVNTELRNEDVTETLSNGENVNSEHRNENIENSMEVEESIENIQQEVERHASGEILADTENVHSLPDVNVTISVEEPGNEEPIVETPIIPNPKISSLLHDWDDNDSQEEDSTVTENKIEESTPVIQNNNVESVKESEEKEDLSNNDKIKSLVSDWDEDDEENKD